VTLYGRYHTVILDRPITAKGTYTLTVQRHSYFYQLQPIV